MSKGRLHAEFDGNAGRRLFTLLRAPAPEHSRGQCVLIVPPFAEELNKSRRAMSETARSLVERGVAAVMFDLFGTGDSEGDFGEATWSRWVDDVRRAGEWSAQQGHPVSGLLGVRLGCALAAAVAGEFGSSVRKLVFWQPVLDGARALDQFLRLRTAASLASEERETVKTLRERLRGGETLEVAGYDVSPGLARELEQVRLMEFAPKITSGIDWFEVVSEMRAAPRPAAEAIERLTTPDRPVAYRQVLGEPFWASTEIVLLRELVDQTVAAFCGVP